MESFRAHPDIWDSNARSKLIVLHSNTSMQAQNFQLRPRWKKRLLFIEESGFEYTEISILEDFWGFFGLSEFQRKQQKR